MRYIPGSILALQESVNNLLDQGRSDGYKINVRIQSYRDAINDCQMAIDKYANVAHYFRQKQETAQRELDTLCPPTMTPQPAPSTEAGLTGSNAS